jgi:hypothetical protein
MASFSSLGIACMPPIVIEWWLQWQPRPLLALLAQSWPGATAAGCAVLPGLGCSSLAAQCTALAQVSPTKA